MIKESIVSLIDPKQIILPNVQLRISKSEHSLTHYFIYAVLLVLVGFFTPFGNRILNFFGYTIASLATPMILFLWLYKISPRKKKRFPVYCMCFGWGAFSGIIASIINGMIPNEYILGISAAFVEEPLKIIGVFFLTRSENSNSFFNDHLDGFLLGAAAGSGFTSVEDLSYVYRSIVSQEMAAQHVLFLRAITVLGHIFFSAIVGRSYGLAKAVKGKVGFIDLVPGLSVSIFLHALWNTLNSYISLGIMWVFMIISFRRLIIQAISDEQKWKINHI